MAIIPLSGDRSAWDMDYPEKHASDIDANVYVHHVPAPTEEGIFLYSQNGTDWTILTFDDLANMIALKFGIGLNRSQTLSYLRGRVDAVTSLDGYISGRSSSSSNVVCYLEGIINSIDAYTYGAGTANTGVVVYTEGQ